VPFFDTHAHLDPPGPGREAALARTARLGGELLATATGPEDVPDVLDAARTHPHVWAALGFHPHGAADASEADWRSLARLAEEETARARAAGRPPRVVAVGETGLDYAPPRGGPGPNPDAGRQRTAFERQLALARGLGLPAIVHSRDAEDDTRALLEPHLRAGGRAAWHCFTASGRRLDGTFAWARDHGVPLGVGGMATWSEATALRQCVARLPESLLLLETDAPYLTPRPFAPGGPEAVLLEEWLAASGAGGGDAAALRTLCRLPPDGPGRPAPAGDGRAPPRPRNEPSGVLAVAAAVAVLRGTSLAHVARTAAANARAFLGLPPAGGAGGEGGGGRVAYPLGDGLYVALTCQCNNDCVFCFRRRSWVMKGHDLRLAAEPGADAVLRAIGEAGGLAPYRELVFCGLGEPLLRLDTLLETCRRVRAGPWGRVRVRVNTNGTAGLALGRCPAAAMAGLVDAVSVSLNAARAEAYAALCRPGAGGPAAYAELERFTRACVARGLETTCTAVRLSKPPPGAEPEAVRQKALRLGARFRLREADE